VNRYRVTTTRIEYRAYGVLTTAYYGDVISLDESAARALVDAGALAPVEPTPST
jgi:hypothetical protein